MPWSIGVLFCLSWYRETAYAGKEFHRSSTVMRGLIDDVVKAAKSGKEVAILHTFLMAFGLALNDIRAAITKGRDSPSPPAYILDSALTKDDLAYVLTEMESLLSWAGHPSYVVSEKRVRKQAIQN